MNIPLAGTSRAEPHPWKGSDLRGTETSFPNLARSDSLDTPVNRGLAFVIGLLLPILTLETGYSGTSVNLASRVALVDLFCLGWLAWLFLRHRMARAPWPAVLYAAAVVVSLIPALLVTPGVEWKAWVGCLALLMAFGFYLAGLNIGVSRVLMRYLIAGACLGLLAESLVVLHDAYAVSHQWFPDPMRGRVRGTFKANGQLGAYGFCAAGLLVTFGTTLIPGRRLRLACVAAALLGSTFVFFASRRTGMISVAAWGAIFAVLGYRFAGERFYRVFLAGFVALLVTTAVLWNRVESSFAGRRLMSAVTSFEHGESFLHDQFHSVLRTADRWFPFGFGVARGSNIDPEGRQEVHNGLMAVLVELGVAGLAGFAGMLALPFLRRRWRPRTEEEVRFSVLLTTFLLSCLVFMVHNTLFRDRAFLLFLGMATAIVRPDARRTTRHSRLFGLRPWTGDPQPETVK